MKRLAPLLMIVSVLGSAGWAQATDYLTDVKPLLRQRCYACHGALKQEAGLRLDTAQAMRQGGDSGRAVRTDQAAASLLIARVTAADADDRMPPEGQPLTAEQVAHLTDWIAAGAIAPDDEVPEADPREHWAFQPPRRPDLPAFKLTQVPRNPIDQFILAEHQRHGLSALPPAEPQVLLRRLFLDLTGLPPSRDELHEYLADPRDDAYERVVERLLASPQYGERWGRHWMDVWRYSDWYGRRKVPDVLNSYAQIWRWRDWIVHSLNADKGYDQMVAEMLAADEIAPTDDENLVATGFLVRNFYRWNYNAWLKDNVEHTGKAFLALTLNCCHCHDHKYDPITHEEYFRFRAFFEPIEIRHDRVPGEADPGLYPKYEYGKAYKPITSGMVRVCDEQLAAETFMYSGGESRNIIPGKPAVLPGGPAILGGDQLTIQPLDLPAQAWYPGLKPSVQREEIAKRETDVAAARQAQPLDEANLARAEAELAAIHARIHADNVRYLDTEGDPDEAARAASRAERAAALATAQHHLALAHQALDHARQKLTSDATATADVTKCEQAVTTAQVAVDKALAQRDVESTNYTLLSPQYTQQSSGRRLALARWIASDRNPLTARVAVNHIWARHFGSPLVATTDNFGRNGALPTHPALLDWLAVELMEHDWNMKHIHRLIVTSQAYRQGSSASEPDDSNQQRDRDNRYLWRFPTTRMEAEVVRDSMLSVSGELDLAMGGTEISDSLGLTNPRRSLYFEHHGEGRMPFLDLFDAANTTECYQRTTSIRPQQALAMVNSELGLRQGERLARHLEASLDAAATHDVYVSLAFEQVLSRPPTTEELRVSCEFLERQVALFASVADAASATEPTPLQRARASLAQALFSHHDFVTIR